MKFKKRHWRTLVLACFSDFKKRTVQSFITMIAVLNASRLRPVNSMCKFRCKDPVLEDTSSPNRVLILSRPGTGLRGMRRRVVVTELSPPYVVRIHVNARAQPIESETLPLQPFCNIRYYDYIIIIKPRPVVLIRVGALEAALANSSLGFTLVVAACAFPRCYVSASPCS